MVPKNGVHFVKVEPKHGQVIEGGEDKVAEEKRRGKFIGTEYVITEMNQILPLYGLTLKRNEYFVIWRDPNFEGENEFSQFLQEAKTFIYKNKNINIYIESSTERALEIIKRKRFNKIILITSIRFDLSGKKFVEIARKILGFNVMVLFFSANTKYLKWVQNFPNALFTSSTNFCQKYINNYSREGLLKLKKENEEMYGIKLTFTKDFMDFPLFINSKNYDDIVFEQNLTNFRRVIIKNRENKVAILMNSNGSVRFVPYEGKDTNEFVWYITLDNDEITLYSNNYYLFFDENTRMVKGDKNMKRWNYKNEYHYKFIIYNENQNNILTVDGEKGIVKNENNYKKNQMFHFVDV